MPDIMFPPASTKKRYNIMLQASLLQVFSASHSDMKNGYASRNADRDKDQNTDLSYGQLDHNVGIWNFEYLLTWLHCFGHVLAADRDHLQTEGSSKQTLVQNVNSCVVHCPL